MLLNVKSFINRLWREDTAQEVGRPDGYILTEHHDGSRDVQMSRRFKENKNVSEDEREHIHTPGGVFSTDGLVFEQTKDRQFIVFSKSAGLLGKTRCIEPLKYPLPEDVVIWPLEKLPWMPPEEASQYESEEALWNEVSAFLVEHLDLEDWRAYEILTGIIFMTWRIEDFSFLCYVYFLGPPSSGKTRGLELITATAYRPLFAASMSSAALFRSVSAWRPTLVLDEVQTYLSQNREEFLSLICAGQRRGQYAIRVEKLEDGEVKLDLHDVFCLKVMASTKETVDTVASRSIILNMSKNVKAVPLFIDEEKAKELRNKLLMYRFKNVGKPLPEIEDFRTFRDGRVVELFYNIARLAPTDAIRDNIIAYAKDFEQERLAEERYGFYAAVFEAFLEAAQEGMEEGKVSVRAVTEKFNQNIPEKEHVKERTIGRALNALGLRYTARMSDGKRARKYIKEKVMRLAKRYIPDRLSTYFSDVPDITDITDEGLSQKTTQHKKSDTPLSTTSETSETSVTQGVCNLCGLWRPIKPMWHGEEKKNVCEQCAKEHLVRPVETLLWECKFSDQSDARPLCFDPRVLAAKKGRVVELFLDHLWEAAVHETIHEVLPYRDWKKLTNSESKTVFDYEREVQKATVAALKETQKWEFMTALCHGLCKTFPPGFTPKRVTYKTHCYCAVCGRCTPKDQAVKIGGRLRCPCCYTQLRTRARLPGNKRRREPVWRFMVWDHVICPKKDGKSVTWEECLSCSDKDKDPSCPFHRLRVEARSREVIPNRYHVTELDNPRYAYFNRKYGYAQGWDKYTDLFLGTAVHRFIQSKYGRVETEVYVEKDWIEFKVVGHVDIVDQNLFTLYELKTYLTIKYLLQRNEPEPDHVFQAQAYYALLKEFRPWMKAKKIKIVYISKTRDGQRWKEFEVKPDPDMLHKLYLRARELHEALKANNPPATRCTRWLCKFCPYTEQCKEAGF